MINLETRKLPLPCNFWSEKKGVVANLFNPKAVKSRQAFPDSGMRKFRPSDIPRLPKPCAQYIACRYQETLFAHSQQGQRYHRLECEPCGRQILDPIKCHKVGIRYDPDALDVITEHFGGQKHRKKLNSLSRDSSMQSFSAMDGNSHLDAILHGYLLSCASHLDKYLGSG